MDTRRTLAAVAALLAVGSLRSFAGAQPLAEDAARVENAWRNTGAEVTRVSPRFLHADRRSRLLPAPTAVLTKKTCTTVLILGERTTSFVLAANDEGARMPRPLVPGLAGVASVSKCGSRRADFDDLWVRVQGGRGAVETLVGHSDQPLPAVEQILPERRPGALANMVEVGPPPDVAPSSVRIADAERRVTNAGGTLRPRRALPPNTSPTGSGLGLELAEGCHRLVLIPATRPGVPFDVDAELHDREDRVLAQDRGSATDAALETCVGQTTAAALVWAGSVANAPVTLVHGNWQIPPGIPREWGPRARAAAATAHRRRRAPALDAPPTWEGEGLSGRTVIPIEPDPSGCYAFVVALTRGEHRGVRAAVHVGASRHLDIGPMGSEASLVTFCAQGNGRVRAEIDVSGSNVHWAAGAWRVGAHPPGAPDPW